METKRKRCKVIMLSTNKSTNIVLVKDGIIGKIIKYHLSKINTDNCDYQHLYITSDDEIKEGDWVYENNLNDEKSIYQIIIKNNKLGFFRFKNVFIPLEKQNNAKKIISSTDKSLNLPQPSKTFIEKYCKLGGIDEIMVEYDFIANNHPDVPSFIGKTNLKINSHNEITIHPIKDSYTRDEVTEICGLYEAIINGNFYVMSEEDVIKRIREIIS